MRMSVEQIVEELKVVRDSFNNEYDACPVCIIEAIRILEPLVGRKEEGGRIMNDDLISRSELRKRFQAILDRGDMFCEYDIIGMVDNAPPVEFPEQVTIKCDTEEDRQKLLSAFRNARVTGFVEFERSQGEWIEDDYAGIHCSECDYIPLKDVVIKIHADGSKEKGGNFNLTPYCPNCGAKMKIGGDVK